MDPENCPPILHGLEFLGTEGEGVGDSLGKSYIRKTIFFYKECLFWLEFEGIYSFNKELFRHSIILLLQTFIEKNKT